MGRAARTSAQVAESATILLRAVASVIVYVLRFVSTKLTSAGMQSLPPLMWQPTTWLSMCTDIAGPDASSHAVRVSTGELALRITTNSLSTREVCAIDVGGCV